MNYLRLMKHKTLSQFANIVLNMKNEERKKKKTEYLMGTGTEYSDNN